VCSLEQRENTPENHANLYTSQEVSGMVRVNGTYERLCLRYSRRAKVDLVDCPRDTVTVVVLLVSEVTRHTGVRLLGVSW
jgi:hypothetical protein